MTISRILNDLRPISIIQKLNETIDNLNLSKNKVTDQTGDISALVSRIETLEQRVSNLGKTNIEPVTVEDAVSLNDNTADYILSGEFSEGSTITGKSATIKDSEVDAAVVNITTTEDVEIKGTDVSGTYDRSTQGNSMLNIHASGYIAIKDCIIEANGYNAIEIGNGTGLAKNVLIDNVDFAGTFSNNTINIFGTEDEAIITISNCHFGTVSNAIRISNRTNCKCTINIINCTVDAWETGDYAGLILLQDYTSGTAELEEENNLFAPEKIKINIQNLTKPDGTKLESPSNMATICASGDENQILYVYGNKSGIIPYSVSKYPQLTIS